MARAPISEHKAKDLFSIRSRLMTQFAPGLLLGVVALWWAARGLDWSLMAHTLATVRHDWVLVSVTGVVAVALAKSIRWREPYPATERRPLFGTLFSGSRWPFGRHGWSTLQAEPQGEAWRRPGRSWKPALRSGTQLSRLNTKQSCVPVVNQFQIVAITCMVSVLAWLSWPELVHAQDPFTNCRLGVAVVGCNPITVYDYDDLNLGWYVNYATAYSPLEPGEIEFVHTVRVHQNKYGWCRDCYTIPISYTISPDPDILRTQVVANPGSIWCIGNEPDRRDWEGGGQDEMVPELYARAYYEIGQIIRQADPTARVGIGGVVQGTPLRLKYLDKVWNKYQTGYGRRLGDDVDVWNVHGFVLREEKNNWGAEIPAGLNDTSGLLIGPGDNDRLDLFQEQVIRFRTWMRDKGERNKPLYITEYGINMPEYYVSPSEVKLFMTGTFDFLLNQKAEPGNG